MNGIVGEVLIDVCCMGLILCGAALFALKVIVPVWDVVRRLFGLPVVQQLIVGVCIVGIVQYGATKSKITFDGGIKQGAQSSVVTNDTIFISWQRDTAGGVYVPESAAVYIDYRQNTATNEDWGLLAQSTVGAWRWSGTLVGATNYDYNVWAYYIPPQPVHTNGIWTYKTLRDRSDRNIIPLRARIEIDGKAISTPDAKRNQEEEDHE